MEVFRRDPCSRNSLIRHVLRATGSTVGGPHAVWHGGQGGSCHGRIQMERETIEFQNVQCIAETDKAIRCRILEKSYWIPKSQVEHDSEVFRKEQHGTLIVTQWWATKEGLV